MCSVFLLNLRFDNFTVMNLKNILNLAFCAVLALMPLSSCGDNEPDKPSTPSTPDNPVIPDPVIPSEKNIAGVWKCHLDDRTIEFDFDDAGNFYQTIAKGEDPEYYYGTYHHNENAGRITLSYLDADGNLERRVDYPVSLSGDTMTLVIDGTSYTFRRLGGFNPDISMIRRFMQLIRKN